MDLGKLLAGATDAAVGRAFGPVIERGDVLVIPVAWVAGGGGAGGNGEGPGDEVGAGQPAPPGASAASGGGFGGFAWPLGVYVVRNGDVRWVPAFDVTRLALAGIMLLRTVAKVLAMRRSMRHGPRPKRIEIVSRGRSH